MGVALVRNECFKNQFLCISTSYISTIIVIIYFIDATDSLGNRISIYINYTPLLGILRGEIHRRKTRVRF